MSLVVGMTSACPESAAEKLTLTPLTALVVSSLAYTLTRIADDPPFADMEALPGIYEQLHRSSGCFIAGTCRLLARKGEKCDDDNQPQQTGIMERQLSTASCNSRSFHDDTSSRILKNSYRSIDFETSRILSDRMTIIMILRIAFTCRMPYQSSLTSVSTFDIICGVMNIIRSLR